MDAFPHRSAFTRETVAIGKRLKTDSDLVDLVTRCHWGCPFRRVEVERCDGASLSSFQSREPKKQVVIRATLATNDSQLFQRKFPDIKVEIVWFSL